ncbi:metallophosphoesterase [Streptomyces sp. NPDC050617]|uniref:metallophosphoesterase n=1 Tax=Streptomyces sp. NPDC050617 TaxID=3154628 RepID=UPI003430E91D
MCADDIPPRADLTEAQWAAERTPHPISEPAPDRATPATASDRAIPGAAPGLAAGAAPALRRRTLLASAAAAVAVGGLASRTPARAAAATEKFPLPDGVGADGSLSVLITGDAGTGKAAQYAVAAAAREVCRAEGVSLAVGLGDNIYENGPESGHDPEFADKFERPNAGIDVPWLMVLGNHDCSGIIPGSGGDPSRGDREVTYAASSRRWYMPARYYSVPIPAGGSGPPLVEFFALDTNPVASTVMQTDPYFTWDGPYMREQRAWLDAALTRSRAAWKVVLGHHPYLNNGVHGDAGAYDGFVIGHYTSGVHLKELYEQVVCGRADLILSGHDHTLQVLEPTARSRGTRQLVCGAASKTGDGRAHGRTPAKWQDFAGHGFMIAKITAERLTVNSYTVDTAAARARLAHSFSSAPLLAPVG